MYFYKTLYFCIATLYVKIRTMLVHQVKTKSYKSILHLDIISSFHLQSSDYIQSNITYNYLLQIAL